jgi:hypothetical protein
MADYPTEACRSCSAPIIWAVTRNGRDMPVTAEPRGDGNVYLVARPGLAPLAEVLGVAKRFARTMRVAHFADCPQADRWRRR